MKKVDFTKIMIVDVEGHEVAADIAAQLGNMMYMQGQSIDECELGRDIYHSSRKPDEAPDTDHSVELDEKQIEIVQRFTQVYSFVMRQAVLKALGKE